MNETAANDVSPLSPLSGKPLGGKTAAALVLIGLTLFTLLAAALPARVKLLGLFPVVFAAILGYVFGRVAVLAGLRRRAVLVPLTMLVVTAGLAGYYGESYRRWRSDRERYFSDHIGAQPGGQQILQRLQGNTLAADPTLRKFDDQYRALMKPSFADYLNQRLASVQVAGRVVEVPPPWPIAFFVIELLLGTAAGVWTAIVAARRTHTPNAAEVPA
jgi:hypothetical protein